MNFCSRSLYDAMQILSCAGGSFSCPIVHALPQATRVYYALPKIWRRHGSVHTDTAKDCPSKEAGPVECFEADDPVIGRRFPQFPGCVAVRACHS